MPVETLERLGHAGRCGRTEGAKFRALQDLYWDMLPRDGFVSVLAEERLSRLSQQDQLLHALGLDRLFELRNKPVPQATPLIGRRDDQ